MRIEVSSTIRGKQYKAPESLVANPTSIQEVQSLLYDIRDYQIDVATSARDDLIRSKDFTDNYRTLIGGKEGSLLELRPLDKIEFISKDISIGHALLDIYHKIWSLSRRDTGKYKARHWVVVNRTIVAKSYKEFSNWVLNVLPTASISKGSTLTFINGAPYARKLERLGVMNGSPGFKEPKITTRKKTWRGRGKGTVTIYDNPQGTYYFAYRYARNGHRYKFISDKIKFQYLTWSSISDSTPPLFGDEKKNGGYTWFRSKGKGHGRPYIYPAIQLRLYEILGGTLS